MITAPMWIVWWSLVGIGWFAWLYPFIFRAPHNQRRESITVSGPTRVGLFLEGLAIFLAFAFHMPLEVSPGIIRGIVALALAVACTAMGWQAVAHLGRQFRVQAGLYHDHQLVRTGPYSIVRHPIYTSLLGMLLCTILLVTQWEWAPLSLALFIVGTEIRVRTEDALLASRFGDDFRSYQKSVPAYIPFVR
jgi:protein-S-isoprenylcysteine O-methyltransferase Ste14